eukprot:6492721-Amphidinium_carterae.2
MVLSSKWNAEHVSDLKRLPIQLVSCLACRACHSGEQSCKPPARFLLAPRFHIMVNKKNKGVFAASTCENKKAKLSVACACSICGKAPKEWHASKENTEGHAFQLRCVSACFRYVPSRLQKCFAVTSLLSTKRCFVEEKYLESLFWWTLRTLTGHSMQRMAV